MSKGKRSRRPNGHPAKIAARREGGSVRRPVGGTPDSLARRLCHEAAGLENPLDTELWASLVLGAIWKRRYDLPIQEMGNYALVHGEPVLAAVARLGGPSAQIALTAIERVDDGELGLLAGQLATRAGGRNGSVPSWLENVGRAQTLRAAVMREEIFDDGFTVFIEARHSGQERHAVGVDIDNNLGVIAKDLLLADSIDSVEEILRDKGGSSGGEMTFAPVELGVAAGHIHTAMELTDMTLGAPLSDDYARLRALAMLRADEIPAADVEPPHAEVPLAERDRLLDEFLSSPEGCAFAPDSDEAYTASLAINFCADYVDGRPLRWSPVVVEVFMADWIPRKVVAGPELLERVPLALDAFIRFAGRITHKPEWAIQETRDAVPRWRDELIESARDVDVFDPGRMLLSAAAEAGIDVSDVGALETFIAGWNARTDAIPFR